MCYFTIREYNITQLKKLILSLDSNQSGQLISDITLNGSVVVRTVPKFRFYTFETPVDFQ